MSNQFENRKRLLPEFRDLFSALFKIPDAAVQKRVLNAINGIIDGTCDCEYYKKTSTIDVGIQTDEKKWILKKQIVFKNERSLLRQAKMSQSTQTEDEFDIEALKSIIKLEPPSNDPEDSQQTSITYYGEDDQYIKLTSEEPFKNKEIRQRRKRTRRVPRAEKVQDTGAKGYIKPTKAPNSDELSDSCESSSTCSKKQKIDDAIVQQQLERFLEENVLDVPVPDTIENIIQQPDEDIVDMMKREYESCRKQTNGQLPIHNAIIENDTHSLNRQIYIFGFLKIPIRSLLTEDHCSPLQLAIKNDCTLKIIEILLAADMDLYEVDAHGNTLFHLMARNTNESEIMRVILNHDKNFNLDFLSETNDDGYTPLHLCVILEKPMLVKAILDFLNSKLKLEEIAKAETNEDKLIEIYGKAINKLHNKNLTTLNKSKMAIIDKKDSKLGSTALLHAIKKNSKLISVMLLANLADPKLKDYSETDCESFANEYHKSRALVSQIINTSIYLEKCKGTNVRKRKPI